MTMETEKEQPEVGGNTRTEVCRRSGPQRFHGIHGKTLAKGSSIGGLSHTAED